MSAHNDLLRQLRQFCPADHDEADYPSCDYCIKRVPAMMQMIDSYVFTHTGRSVGGYELWTCDQAAKHMRLASGDVARAQLSRMKVKAHGYRPHPVTGRAQALYLADQVRDVVTSKETSP